jgi:hypothetical protein
MQTHEIKVGWVKRAKLVHGILSANDAAHAPYIAARFQSIRNSWAPLDFGFGRQPYQHAQWRLMPYSGTRRYKSANAIKPLFGAE